MEVYTENSQIQNKVELVADLMDKLRLRLDYVSGQLRFSDVKVDNAILIDMEGQDLEEFPPCSEFRLKKFNT